MKLQGFVGTGSGKMGASVFSVRNGQQIVRQYQGNVLNPKTTGQIEQRAMLKLSSQVAAALGKELRGFRNLKPGQSFRNAFVKTLFNDGALSYDSTNNKATMNTSSIKLTDSNLAFGSVGAVSVEGNAIHFNVVPLPEYQKAGCALVAVVIRPVANGGVEVIAKSTTAAAATMSVSVITPSTPQQGDRVIMYMVYPNEAEVNVNYINAVGTAVNGNIDLSVVISRYASYLNYTKSLNTSVGA